MDTLLFFSHQKIKNANYISPTKITYTNPVDFVKLFTVTSLKVSIMDTLYFSAARCPLWTPY
jgi:hypothetical protein